MSTDVVVSLLGRKHYFSQEYTDHVVLGFIRARNSIAFGADSISLGGYPLGSRFTSAGSIYVFIILIFLPRKRWVPKLDENMTFTDEELWYGFYKRP